MVVGIIRKAEQAKRPVVRERSDHTVSRKQISQNALKVLYRLNHCGHKAYLVGGGVRDLLLGRNPKDFDVSTDARPRRVQRLFRNAYLIGRRFRLVHIKFGEEVIETSTFRRQPEETGSENGDGSLYHHSDNTYGTPEEDARRRDFTINALFYDVESFSVIDHVGGLKDLDRKLVRCIGQPDIRFQEDPVRMLRAVRFAARLEFKLEPRTRKAILKHHAKILQSPAPRLLEELYRLFPFRSGERALRLLKACRLSGDLIPELEPFMSGRQSALFWGILRELDAAGDDEGKAADPALIFACLLYPAYRAAVSAAGRGSGKPDGAAIARDVLGPISERFRIPRKVYYEVVQILNAQRRFEKTREKFSHRRFAQHPCFGQMLALREIVLKATDGDLASIEEWKSLHAEHAHQGFPAGRRRPGRRRPRGRRGRGGRSAGGEGQAAASAERKAGGGE